MATSASSVVLLDHAMRALALRCSVSSLAASSMLLESADELGVDVGDLAALVLATEYQHQDQTQGPSPKPTERGRVRHGGLFVVEDDEPIAIRSVYRQQPSGGINSWVMLDPGRMGCLSWSNPPATVVVSASPRSTTTAATVDRLRATAERFDDGLADRSPSVGAWPDSDPGFSARESAIVVLLARGLSNQQVADSMLLSLSSVKNHIRAAYRKMDVHTRVQAVLWATDHQFRAPDAGRTWEPTGLIEPFGTDPLVTDTR